MGKQRIRFFAGVFLVSSATLCLEISLIRFFSISQQYHFAFLVVSIAFLGYGASGSFLSLSKKIFNMERDKFLPFSTLLFSLFILLSYLLSNAIAFDFIKLSWDSHHIFTIFLYYFLLCLPFFFAGMTISFSIARTANLVNKVYFSDLLGAGAGALLSLVVFLPKGDKGVILLISLLACFASYFFSYNRSYIFKGFLIFLMITEAALFILSPSWLSLRISSFKALPFALRYPQSQLILTKWNAISRIDVLESPAVRFAPGLSLLYDKNLPSQLGLSIDGGELNAITSFNKPNDQTLEFLASLPSSLAYSLVKNPKVLIIEPKGGLDTLTAFVNKASHIKVIESNPLLVDILRNELASFSGNLYQKKNIHIVSSNSRSALKREKDNYDLVAFSLTDVFGASGTGMYGFGEQYLYTVESFSDIINRLSPQGIISMSLYLLPPPRQEIRALATWIEALEKNNKNPSTHILAIRSWGTIHFFIRNCPFSESEIKKLKSHSETYLFDLVHYPGIKAEETNIHNQFKKPIYFNLTQQMLSPSLRKMFYENYLFDVRPVSDNRPFFYNFFKTSKIRATYKALGQKWLPFLQGKFLMPLLLIQMGIIAFIMILLPFLVLKKGTGFRKKAFLKVFFYFGSIGMAFIFVEITFIQKFILFLGDPLYSAAVIIFSFLLSSGIGSLSSVKILGHKTKRRLRYCLIFLAVLIAAMLFLFPFFYNHFLRFNLLLKVIMTFVFIFPLGFLMGFPFPTGIRLLSLQEKKLIPWAWATNAFSTVLHSVLALMIAFAGGYNLVLLLAAGGYLFTLPLLGFASHRNKADS